MSVTLGLILRYDQMPIAQPIPSAASTGATHEVQAVWVPPNEEAAKGGAAAAANVQGAQTLSSESATSDSSSHSSWQHPSSIRFPAYASTTYGPRGQPNRPWIPESGRLDIYA